MLTYGRLFTGIVTSARTWRRLIRELFSNKKQYRVQALESMPNFWAIRSNRLQNVNFVAGQGNVFHRVIH